MKKLTFCFCVLLIACCTVASCSNDDAYGEDTSSEAKLAWIKQQYLNYGRIYGVDNIGFDDSKLMNHLYLTKNDIEKEVMTMALSNGSYNGKTNTLRKKTRSGGVGDNEENGDHHTFVYVDGTFDNMVTRNDTVVINYTACYFFSETGSRQFNVTLNYAQKRIKDSNNNWQEIDINRDKVKFYGSFDTLGGTLGGNPGNTVTLDLYYSLYLKITDESWKYEEYFSDSYNLSAELKELWSI